MSASTVTTTVDTTVAPVDDSSKKQRRVVNSASVNTSFDEVQSLVQKKIAELRADSKSKSRTTGVKLLLSISSQLKQLQKDVNRVMDAPKKRERTAPATNSGFLKPHRIVPSMCEFAGWEKDSMHSRVDITKAIVKYIKDNQLADPAHKKNIRPDEKLSKLLDVSSSSEEPPLTYFGLQKLIGKLQDKSVVSA